MEDYIPYLIIACIVGLFINGILATSFKTVAEEKGYSDGAYFWIPFLFGLAGWILVAALPDRAAPRRPRARVEEKRDELPDL